MMLPAQVFSLRIEGCSRQGLMGFLGLGVFILSVFILVAAAGPDVYRQVGSGPESLKCAYSNCTFIWEGVVSDLSPLNRHLVVAGLLKKPARVGAGAPDDTKRYGFVYHQPVEVAAWGKDKGDHAWKRVMENSAHVHTIKCPVDASECQPFHIFTEDVLQYDSYRLVIGMPYQADVVSKNGLTGELEYQFAMRVVDRRYSTFEICWKYVLNVGTVVLGLQFYKALRATTSPWSYEQRWISALLPLLFLFNDPFVLPATLKPHIVWIIMYSIFLGAFLAALLLFWLCILDAIRLVGNARVRPDRRGTKFYLPKILLVGTVGAASLAAYIWVQVKTHQDPTFSTDSMDKFQGLRLIGLLVTFVYAVWTAGLVLWIPFTIRVTKMNLPFIFIFFHTAMSVILVLVGIVLGIYGPPKMTSLLLLTFYSGASVYVWMLTLAYAPVREWEPLQVAEVGSISDGCPGESPGGTSSRLGSHTPHDESRPNARRVSQLQSPLAAGRQPGPRDGTQGVGLADAGHSNEAALESLGSIELQGFACGEEPTSPPLGLDAETGRVGRRGNRRIRARESTSQHQRFSTAGACTDSISSPHRSEVGESDENPALGAGPPARAPQYRLDRYPENVRPGGPPSRPSEFATAGTAGGTEGKTAPDGEEAHLSADGGIGENGLRVGGEEVPSSAGEQSPREEGVRLLGGHVGTGSSNSRQAQTLTLEEPAANHTADFQDAFAAGLGSTRSFV